MKASAIVSALFAGKPGQDDSYTIMNRIRRYERDPASILGIIKDAQEFLNNPPTYNADETKQYQLRKAVRHVRQKNAEKAMQILTSNDTLMTPSPETANSFATKIHASPFQKGMTSTDPVLTNQPNRPRTTIKHQDIEAALSPLPASGAGPDGLTWTDIDHISRDPIASNVLVQLVEKYINAELPVLTMRTLVGGKGIALKKPDGGIRPICIPYVLHRLATKIMAKTLNLITATETSPYQFGIQKKGGRDILIHMARAMLEDDNQYMISLDIKGAFSNVNRSAVLHRLTSHPNLAPLVPLFQVLYPPDAQQGPIVQLGQGKILVMEKGLAQGCALSPALFSLALDTALREAAKNSQTQPAAYIDDVQNVNTLQNLNSFVASLHTELSKIGLELAPHKSKLYSPNPIDQNLSTLITEQAPQLAAFEKTNSLTYLGAGFGPLNDIMKIKQDDFKNACTKVRELSGQHAQAAWILLKTCLTARGHELGRNHHRDDINETLQMMDEELIKVAEDIIDRHQPGAIQIKDVPYFTDILTLPTSKGGFGFRLPTKTADAAWTAAAVLTIDHHRQLSIHSD